MNVPVWAAEMATAFWSEAGSDSEHPRDLEGAVARALPLTVKRVPNLSLEGAANWLRMLHMPFRVLSSDRLLHGLIVTHCGVGVVFLNGLDEENEQRFSLAHELAHYLRDYRRPRDRVKRHLGDYALEAFDGRRAPTFDERVVGALELLSLHCEVHILERNRDGRYANNMIADAERDADRLAFELLAPAQHLATEGLLGIPRGRWSEVLCERYGLPSWAAVRYADLLEPQERGDSLLGTLFAAKGT